MSNLAMILQRIWLAFSRYQTVVIMECSGIWINKSHHTVNCIFIKLINVFYSGIRNLYKNVVQKLNEAEDISMHLKTIIEHFKVRIVLHL